MMLVGAKGEIDESWKRGKKSEEGENMKQRKRRKWLSSGL
jgi:hypothetical protein